MKSELEALFGRHIADEGLITPHEHYKFHPGRDWEYDFAWPSHMVAVEIEGGTWAGGRHTRGVGFENDCRKYAAGNWHGWMILRFTSKMVKSGEAIKTLRRVLQRGAVPLAELAERYNCHPRPMMERAISAGQTSTARGQTSSTTTSVKTGSRQTTGRKLQRNVTRRGKPNRPRRPRRRRKASPRG